MDFLFCLSIKKIETWNNRKKKKSSSIRFFISHHIKYQLIVEKKSYKKPSIQHLIINSSDFNQIGNESIFLMLKISATYQKVKKLWPRMPRIGFRVTKYFRVPKHRFWNQKLLYRGIIACHAVRDTETGINRSNQIERTQFQNIISFIHSFFFFFFFFFFFLK
jgi:hypothetical protein